METAPQTRTAPARERPKMFYNLIESDSHRDELTRKSRFLLGTLAVYTTLFLVGGVVSIYAYDANLDKQSLELVALLQPVPASESHALPDHDRPRTTQRASDHVLADVRRDLYADVNRPELQPKDISTKGTDVLPVRRGVPMIVGEKDINAYVDPTLGGPAGKNPFSGHTDTGNFVKVEEPPPPLKIIPKPKTPPVISKGVLNGQALYLPKPVYPALARAAHAQGAVTVQILLDESGKVISAHALNGQPLLLQAAVQAAYQARFSPTLLSEQPVKVSGTITYNFIPQ